MKITKQEYREAQYDYPTYCENCDEIVDFGFEPDNSPTHSPDYECVECDSRGTCYGMEAAMIRGLIEIND